MPSSEGSGPVGIAAPGGRARQLGVDGASRSPSPKGVMPLAASPSCICQRSALVPTNRKSVGSSLVPGRNSTTSRVVLSLGRPTRTSRIAPLPRTLRLREGAPGRSSQSLGPTRPRPSSKNASMLVPGGVRSSNAPERLIRQAARALPAQAGKAEPRATMGRAATKASPDKRARRREENDALTDQNRAGRRCLRLGICAWMRWRCCTSTGAIARPGALPASASTVPQGSITSA
jgi:hypothetical protein